MGGNDLATESVISRKDLKNSLILSESERSPFSVVVEETGSEE